MREMRAASASTASGSPTTSARRIAAESQGRPALSQFSTAVVIFWSMISSAAGTSPDAMTCDTVRVAPSSSSKSRRSVLTSASMGRSRTKARVTHPECAFRSNHQPLQVQTRHVGSLAAEDEGLATGQDHLHAEDMAGGGTLGQTVGPARIVGDIAADRARRLRGRIGGEGQTEWLGLCAQVEIDHAGSDPRGPVLDVDVDLVHRGGGQDDPAVDGYRPGGEPGPGTAGDDRDAVSLRHPNHLGHFLGGLGENDTSRLALHEGGISRIEIELDRLFEHPILTQHSTQIPDKAHSVEGSCGR